MQQVAREQKTTILQFALGEPVSYRWVTDGNAMRAVRLPRRATIERAVRSIRAHLSRPPRSAAALAELQAASSRLYRLSFRSVRVSGRVVIVPDGLLYYLPFEALAAGSLPNGEPLYVNDTATVSYAAPASVLAEGAARPRAAFRKELLAYGAPATSRRPAGDLATVICSGDERAGFNFAPLRAQKGIGWLEPDVRFRSEPRRVRFGRRRGGVQVGKPQRYRRIPVASHAVLDESRPQRSGVVFSMGGAASQEDGILRMNEILNLRLNADLVVLSACETGLGQMVRGEGMVGLTRALVYAGRVGVSLWAVNDASTAELMAAFYAGMRAGKPVTEALRAAPRKVAREMGEAYRPSLFLGAVRISRGALARVHPRPV